MEVLKERIIDKDTLLEERGKRILDQELIISLLKEKLGTQIHRTPCLSTEPTKRLNGSKVSTTASSEVAQQGIITRGYSAESGRERDIPRLPKMVPEKHQIDLDSQSTGNGEHMPSSSDMVKHVAETFTEVRRSKIKRRGGKPRSNHRESVVGTAITEASCPLVAAPRRLWIHVSKLSLDATKDNVLVYLKSKIPDTVFECEKLPTLGTNSAFKVGAPFNLLEELNNSNFWPAGTRVRRFFLSARKVPEPS